MNRYWRMMIGYTIALLLLMFTATNAVAQNTTIQYIYDELEQLKRAIDSTGVSIEYVYDEVGNHLVVNRSTLGRL